MSKRKQASLNPTLTNYATGLAQDITSSLAEFLAPQVEVPSTLGQYKKFDDKNAFQLYNTARAMGGSATRIEFNADDAHYNCKPQALEIAIDDAERDAAGEDDTLRLDESKVRTLVTTSTVSHEYKVVQAVVNAVTPEAGYGAWSDPDADPIEELDALIEAISTQTGMLPNRLALGLPAWRAARSHPKIRARQPGADLIGLTPAQFAAMLLNPSIEIRIGILSSDSTKMGKAAAKANIVGANALLFIGSQNPTQYDPSFAKTFTGRKGGVTSVRSYREEPFSDVHLVDWSEDIEITGTLCGKRLAIT